ncbi:hypothetical protein Bwad005_32680 [Bilophila wadsworthia]
MRENMSSFRDSKRYGAIRSEDVHSFISSVNFEKKEFKSTSHAATSRTATWTRGS